MGKLSLEWVEVWCLPSGGTIPTYFGDCVQSYSKDMAMLSWDDHVKCDYKLLLFERTLGYKMDIDSSRGRGSQDHKQAKMVHECLQ